ncbi:MAG: HIT family protein [Synergistaceae bacterium]|nr:HIT family protein [Synergistaceae bacterium]
MSCIFCEIDDYILDNELVFAVFDKTPINKGHMLFITKRHVENFFDITKEEREAIFELIDEAKPMLDQIYSPEGYNIGVNIGKVAGQSVMHVHVHLIPRYSGDTEAPNCGVRSVIPEKMKYI